VRDLNVAGMVGSRNTGGLWVAERFIRRPQVRQRRERKFIEVCQ
jgi:hypothetical protein